MYVFAHVLDVEREGGRDKEKADQTSIFSLLVELWLHTNKNP